MSIKALQEYTRIAKYARYNPKHQRRETWKEQVDRVFDMHITHLGDKYELIKEDVEFAREMMYKKRILGSQRALQFGGPAILQKNARLYNCSTSYVDRPEFFRELMFMCLCGVGCGFSVQKHHIAKLPPVTKRDPNDVFNYVIPDSIEGWSDAIDILMSSYFVGTDYTRKTIKFDYSLIRPAGALIKSSGAKAPGPDGLRRSIDKIAELLDDVTNDGEVQMRPIHAYDVVMHASDAVVSGGIRRAATLCMFSYDDDEMMKAKTGDWFTLNPQRGRSNNSVMLVRDKISEDEFNKIFESVRQFGEPGFIFADDTEVGFNPCFHRDTRLATKNGLIRIGDLYDMGTENKLVIDRRARKGNEFNAESYGTQIVNATKVHLTGKKQKIYKMTLDDGSSIKVTAYHEFPTKNGRKQLKDINVGDTLYLQSGVGSFGDNGTYEDGFILGLITSDGFVSGNGLSAFIDIWQNDFVYADKIKGYVNRVISNDYDGNTREYGDIEWINQTTTKIPKKRIGGRRLATHIHKLIGVDIYSIKDRVPDVIFRGSRDMIVGYIQGMLFVDDPVQLKDRGSKSFLSLLNQSNKNLLLDFQILLKNFGISSRIYSRRCDVPNGKGSSDLYLNRENFDLIINRPNIYKFKSEIGLVGSKKEQLDTCLGFVGNTSRKPERYISKVKSIEFDCIDDVFCLTQPETNTVIANGIVAGQCVEIAMYPRDEITGKSGWSNCNLSEINMKKVKSEDDFLESCRAAAVLGSIQASYTDFPYLGETTESIVRREALLGVSMTGMMDSPEIAFDPDIQKTGAEVVKRVNKEIANKIGINPASRTTCVKPAGSTSCILGSSSGIHPHHSKRYFRRVQGNTLENPLQFFKLYNPRAVDKSVWDSNGKTEVITFLCEVPDSAKTKVQINAISLLDHVRLTQQNWVEYGTNIDRCVKPWLRHNVSNTINVKDTEWDDVKNYIYTNRKYFAGISLLPMSGDKDYPQAPFTAVYTPDEIVKLYGDASMMASGLIVDALRVFNDDLWSACSCVLGLNQSELEMPDLNGMKPKKIKEIAEKVMEKQDWVRRAKKFAYNYFITDEFPDGDIRKMTYLLKDVHNWKLWCDLKREYEDVPWEQLYENVDNTKLSETVACAGGKCDTSLDI